MQLIAVVMGASSRDERNSIARELLDYGFANYGLYECAESYVEDARVLGGVSDKISLYSLPYSSVINKTSLNNVELIYEIPETVVAPIQKGQTLGKVIYKLDGEQIGFSDIVAGEDVSRIKYGEILIRMLKRMISG
jgi:D-alanyl-D-alanine carboxypeptidase (penicillin-binding protein 5/6)